MKKTILFIFIAVLLAATLACSLSSLTGPRLVVTLAPESGNKWDDASMAQARDVILSRLNSVGVRATASISSDGNLQINLPTSINMESVLPLLYEKGEITFVDSLEPAGVGETITDNMPVILTNGDIAAVSVTPDSLGNDMISLLFTPAGTQKMADYSSKNIGHYLMIARDGVVISAPRIDSAISDGKAVINGNFTQDSANVLAAQLKTIALPFPLKIVESTTK